ncbi:hypothetical protein EYV94_27015 [Puteibacter caeruleilacunae]|nr:hypothetical protein EYV94_27015 [Puteibacter caeruleilacunae]
MTRTLLTIALFLCACMGMAKPQGDEKAVKAKFSGFVRSDFAYDNRKNAEAIEGLVNLYPLKPNYGKNGEDLNKETRARFLSLATRVRSKITGPEILGAQTSGLVEVDFTGGSVTNSVRFRHAYTKLAWENTSLLIGRTWHPLFVEKVFPTVIALSTGAPFQVFNRSPQVRVTHHMGNYTLVGGLIYQSRYTNLGPGGKSADYQRNAAIPNMHAQLQYDHKGLIWGLGLDYKYLQPMTELNGYKVDKKVGSGAILTYASYKTGKLNVKAKYMYGQNMTDHLLAGGYAVKTIDADNGIVDYTVSNHSYSWINVLYGKDVKVGAFAGYFKNHGMKDNIAGDIYARGADLEYGYRLSGLLMWYMKNVSFGLEPEYTAVAYGDIDKSNKGKVLNASEVGGFRMQMSLCYTF